MKKVTKLCDLCQKNVTTSVLNVLRKIRETERESVQETGNAKECKILSEYLTENLPLSSCAEILDSVLQDGEHDNEIKARRTCFFLHSQLIRNTENVSAIIL